MFCFYYIYIFYALYKDLATIIATIIRVFADIIPGAA
jgi:hypothetical protein